MARGKGNGRPALSARWHRRCSVSVRGGRRRLALRWLRSGVTKAMVAHRLGVASGRPSRSGTSRGSQTVPTNGGTQTPRSHSSADGGTTEEVPKNPPRMSVRSRLRDQPLDAEVHGRGHPRRIWGGVFRVGNVVSPPGHWVRGAGPTAARAGGGRGGFPPTGTRGVAEGPVSGPTGGRHGSVLGGEWSAVAPKRATDLGARGSRSELRYRQGNRLNLISAVSPDGCQFIDILRRASTGPECSGCSRCC
jgi:hypothetical protein